MDIDLRDYTAGGYFITKYAQRDENRSPDLFPEQLISLSSHISPGKASIYWGWDIDKNRDEALAFGIPAAKLPELATWYQATHEVVGFPDVYYTLDAAREFVEAFLPVKDNLVVLGIALPKSLVDGFLGDNQQTSYNPNTQEYSHEPYGINLALSKREPLLPSGEILGFEVVSHYYNLGCSWLCSGLERDMHQEFGIRPGKYGLIETFEEANKVYEWILEGEKKGEQRAEPEPYYPWLIVQYPLV